MSRTHTRLTVGTTLFAALMLTLATYFTFAAVQGDYGLFRRVQVSAEADELRRTRDRLAADLAEIENRTRRLSDAYLDLDLLDERARDVLGLIRADEIVIR